jgi:hypothetical protein
MEIISKSERNKMVQLFTSAEQIQYFLQLQVIKTEDLLNACNEDGLIVNTEKTK